MQIKYYVVKTMDGHIVQISERKMTKRDALGRFVGNGRPRCGFCRPYGVCPFMIKGL